MSESAHELSLALPAAHAAVRVARHLVRHFARLEGLADREVDTLVLMTSELLSNAVDHGGGGAAMVEAEVHSNARMHLHLALDREQWRMEVSDQGGGDARAIARRLEQQAEAPEGLAAEADDLPELEGERGRGMFLIAHSVDAFEVLPSRDGLGVMVVATRRHTGR